MKKPIYLVMAALAVSPLLPSCTSLPKQEVFIRQEKPEYAEGSLERFVYLHSDYPKTMEIFRNPELLAKADGKSPIHICLDQQRGRLYVDGKVAADWPVSTGTYGHLTPPGKYSVIEKKKQYESNRYGNIYNEKGKMVKYNADIFEEPVPEGCVFKGSPMPNWMRLTWDGVGMHTGKVEAGKRLSHGCIRTPDDMAKQLFEITRHGTKVEVADAKEALYPAALVEQAKIDGRAEDKREKDIKAKNAAIWKQWEKDHPKAAKRYRERKAKEEAAAKAKAAEAAPATARH